MRPPLVSARLSLRSSLRPLCVAAVLAAGPAAAAGLDPDSFSAIATLTAGSQVTRLFIDTDTLGAVATGRDGGRYVGQLFTQGGGLPDVAVFTFGDLSVKGLVVSLSGSRPVAILSHADMVLGDVIVNFGTLGGAAGGTIASEGTMSYTSASGAGAGGPGIAGALSGGGGGFGGNGGGTAGGAANGDLMRGLQGGSGGGPSSPPPGPATGGSWRGGHGGGAVELGAIGRLSVGAVTADGGGLPNPGGPTGVSDSGGGSGGAILLHGAEVQVTSLSARGGDGGSRVAPGTRVNGGGGGGGRILVQESGATLELSADGKPVNGNASGGAAFDPSLKGQGGELTYVAGTVRVGKGVATLTGSRIAYGDAPAAHGGPDQKGALNDIGFLHLLVDTGTTVNATTLDGMTGSIDVVGRLVVAGAVGRRPDLSLLGGTLVVGGGYRLAEGEGFAGFGAIAGTVRGAANSRFVAQGGDLALGDRTSFSGFVTDGEIVTGANAVQLLARGFATLGQVTTLAGGRLSAPGGVALLGGRSIEGYGTVAARIAANAGSTIDATGALDLGTATATDGFFSEGQLNVGAHVVTLHDRNEAVLGSMTTIAGGTLRGVNGILIGEGRNLEGFGTIAGKVVNQGSVYGPTSGPSGGGDAGGGDPLPGGDDPGGGGPPGGGSPGGAFAPVTVIGGGTTALPTLIFTGDVTGRGSFSGNVQFLGTYSPGNSPAIVTHENTSFGADAHVIIEIGGLIAGDKHDRIDVAGNAALAGTLELALIDGFAPQAGNRFEILRYGTRTGTFAHLAGLGLAPGLRWSLDYGAHSLFADVQAVPEPQTWALFGVGLASLALLRRRR